MRIVDLSKTIEYNKTDPRFMRIRIKNHSHGRGGFIIRNFLHLPRRLFPKKLIGWADDKVMKMGVHSSTHIDAPWHYGPKVNGVKAKTIDEIPLEWLFGKGIVLDMSFKKDFEIITVDDIKNEVNKTGVKISEGTIVLIRTLRDKYKGKEYMDKGTGMSKEATEWLIDKGIKVIGIDQWGFDLPLKYMIAKAKETNDSELFWQAHLVGTEKEYLHIEQLTNLDSLPHNGFKVAVFPLKIKGGSAAPARVVAIFE